MSDSVEVAPSEAAHGVFVHRSVLFAAAGFVAAAYFFFLITHIPQAGGTNGLWNIEETEGLRILGPRPGQLVTMIFRGEGVASVAAGEGSRVTDPDQGSLDLLKTIEPNFQPAPVGSRLNIRIANDDGSLASVSVLLNGDHDGKAKVDIQPDTGPDETGMRLQASGAAMTVTVDWSSPLQSSQQKGPLLVGKGGTTLPLSRAVISVPEGKMLYVGAPTSKTRFEIGSHADRLSAGGLEMEGMQIAGEGDGPVTSEACGANRLGQLRGPRPFGGFALEACRETLHMQDLQLGAKSTFALSGPAFVKREGSVRYWPIVPNLMSNLVLQFALTGLVGALIGWVTLNLRLRNRS